MNKENKSLEKNSIFSKLKSWLHNLFHKLENNDVETQNSEVNTDINKHKEPTIFDEYRQIDERREYLLQLQRKFENQEILEENINSEDKDDLENLYVEQIRELKRKIRAIEIKRGKRF